MTCRSRSLRSGVVILALVALPASVSAAELPPIKVSATNTVAECATPGRLMSFLRERNAKLNSRYDGVASEYMRHGEALHVRWDYAFFQMLLETGYLTYTGDVRADQNNFAGLGATGGGVHGESFKDISSGVRAHIEHLLMYSGERVENPTAERTRNIQEWGVLTSWQSSISGPITFAQLAKKWAPTSKRYATDISAIAERFLDGPCKDADPQPELVAEVRGTAVAVARDEAPARVEEAPARVEEVAVAQVAPAASAKSEASAGSALPAAAEQDDATGKLPAKGAAAVAAVAAEGTAKQPQKAKVNPPLTVLNPTKDEAPAADQPAASAKTDAAPAKTEKAAKAAKNVQVAALPGAIKGAGKVETAPKKTDKPEKSDTADKPATVEKKVPPPAGSQKCRVWTASYGGSKAIIIKAMQDKTVNYTVLDVNDGAEKREADAYISAYAKGGQSVGEFASQSLALEKAFELCPEG